MNEPNTIGVTQCSIEPQDTGLRVHLRFAYTTREGQEEVTMSVDLPAQDSRLSEIQQQAIDRAKLILDLSVAAAGQASGSQAVTGDVLALWKKLGA